MTWIVQTKFLCYDIYNFALTTTGTFGYMKLILYKFFRNPWFELPVHKIVLAFKVILLARNNFGKLISASIWDIITQIEFTKISCVTETIVPPLKFKKTQMALSRKSGKVFQRQVYKSAQILKMTFWIFCFAVQQ